MTAPVLRPYQEAALNAIAASHAAGNNRLLVQMSTGLGKTVMFARLLTWPPMKAWLDAQAKTTGARLLVIAHREELLRQAQEKIQAANPGLMVSIEQGDLRASRYSDVVVASIQTLTARKCHRLKHLLERHTFRIVVGDEAHHFSAASYRTALVHLGFLPPADASDREETEAANFEDVEVMRQALVGWDAQAPKDRLLVGVTATPNRTDAVGLSCVFQTIAYSHGLRKAIDDGWLVPIVPWVVDTDTSLDGVKISHGEFNQRELAETVNTPGRNKLAVEALLKYAPKESALAFTVDVQHAHDLASAFRTAGVQASALSGETPKDDRRAMLRAYTEGRVQVITNCMVLTEGTDLPRTGCILHAKPTKSATLYEQMTGRGLRIFPNKTQCIVIDVVDIARRHSLASAPMLYGLPPGLTAKGQDLRALSDGLEKLREDYPNFDADAALLAGRCSLDELRVQAQTFDVWTVQDAGEMAGGLSLNWLRVGTDTFRISYPWADGTEVVSVGPDLLGHMEVACTLRPRGTPGHAQPPARQRTIAVDLANVLAGLQTAEAFIARERASVKRLKGKDEPWMQRPASPKQVAFLKRLKVPFNAKSVTMGQASNLIDVAMARKGR